MNSFTVSSPSSVHDTETLRSCNVPCTNRRPFLAVMETGESLREDIALHEEFMGYLLDAEDDNLLN